MREIHQTIDPVEISYLKAMLADEGIEVLVYDQNMSALYGDNMLFPKRLMVLDEDYFYAISLVKKLISREKET